MVEDPMTALLASCNELEGETKQRPECGERCPLMAGNEQAENESLYHH